MVDKILTDDSHSVSQEMATSNLVESTQVRKARGTDLAAVWPFGAITDQENAHLTLGCLNDRVGLTRRNRIALGVQEEVVDECLHVLLHSDTGRWRDLVVFDADWAGRHLVQALMDDAKGLAELLHTAEITVVAVPIDADGDVKVDLVIGVIRLRLADIPRNTGPAEHHTSEAHVQCLRGGDNTNALGTRLPDSVIREQLLGLVNAVTELRGPLVDIVEEAKRNVLMDTARADVSSVETGTGNSLVEFLFAGYSWLEHSSKLVTIQVS